MTQSKKGVFVMYKVMVIEDDFNISRIMGESLEKENFEVRRIDDFSKIMEEFIAFSQNCLKVMEQW